MSQPESCIAKLPDGAQIVAGHSGDHRLIQQLLLETLQVRLEDDFQSRVDDPAYRPSDRLLVRIKDLLTAHVHVSSHVGMFCGERIPLVWLENLAVLPEYAQQRHQESLLQASESIAAQEGAVMAITVTDRPSWFEERGWTKLASQGHTRANVRATLAHFDAQEATRSNRMREQVEVRSWRHFELDLLRDLYEGEIRKRWGPLVRSERCWQWLIGRKAHDQILVATSRRTSNDGRVAAGAAVGYAVIRDSCVIEMFTLPDYWSARTVLLTRACRDAIDRDHHFVSLHTAADDPLHEIMVTAGGTWVGDGMTGGERWMVKLLAPHRWIERLFPVLHQRARTLDIERPVTISFAVKDAHYQLTQTRRSARLQSTASTGGDVIKCDWANFQDLLLGNYASPLLDSESDIGNRATRGLVAALLPPKLLWQSPFELIRL